VANPTSRVEPPSLEQLQAVHGPGKAVWMMLLMMMMITPTVLLWSWRTQPPQLHKAGTALGGYCFAVAECLFAWRKFTQKAGSGHKTCVQHAMLHAMADAWK
jgi:hypothetical protein